MTANNALKVLGIVAVYVLNIAFAFFAAVITGSAQGIYFVGSIFGIVNIVSIVRAIALIVKNRHASAFAVAALTSPAAVAITFVLGLAIAILRKAI